MTPADYDLALTDLADHDPQTAGAALTRLEEEAATDPAVAAEVVAYYRTHCALRALHAPPTACAAQVCQDLACRRVQRRWRWGAALALSAGVLLALGWVLLAPAAGSKPATEHWGMVQAGRVEGLPEERSWPQPGDDLLIGGATPAVLDDRHGARFICTPESRLQTTATGLRLERGAVTVIASPRPPDSPLEILTERARFRVVGTRFQVRVGDHSTLLTVAEGVVAVQPTAGGAEQIVQAGGQWQAGDQGQSGEQQQEQAGGQGQAGHAPLPASVLRLDFEGFDGRRVTDLSPQEQQVWVTRIPDPAPGIRGMGLRCDGDGVLLVADDRSLSPARGTYCFWLKPNRSLPDHEELVPGQPVEFFNKADWDSKQGWELLRPAHGEERWGLRLLLGPDALYHCYAPPPTRTDWFHVAVSWGEGNARFTVDGQEVARSAIPDEAIPIVAGDARIGNNFFGILDEIRLYDTVLSPAQIEAVAAGE